MLETFWNGMPCAASIVRIRVGKPARPTYWWANLEGSEREVVEVRAEGGVFYLDNEQTPHNIAGGGWAKVTYGHGSPNFGHSEIGAAEVLEEIEPKDSPNVQALYKTAEPPRGRPDWKRWAESASVLGLPDPRESGS